MTATVTPMRAGHDPSAQAIEEARALRTVAEVMRACALSLPRRSSIRRGLTDDSVDLAEKAQEILAPPDEPEAS